VSIQNSKCDAFQPCSNVETPVLIQNWKCDAFQPCM